MTNFMNVWLALAYLIRTNSIPSPLPSFPLIGYTYQSDDDSWEQFYQMHPIAIAYPCTNHPTMVPLSHSSIIIQQCILSKKR